MNTFYVLFTYQSFYLLIMLSSCKTGRVICPDIGQLKGLNTFNMHGHTLYVTQIHVDCYTGVLGNKRLNYYFSTTGCSQGVSNYALCNTVTISLTNSRAANASCRFQHIHSTDEESFLLARTRCFNQSF